MRDEIKIVYFENVAGARPKQPTKESKRKTLLYGELQAVTEAPPQAHEEELDELAQAVLNALGSALSPLGSQK